MDLKMLGWPRFIRGVVIAVAVLAATPCWAIVGSFFLTGHDPDFHATLGGNATGAQHINTAAIDFVMDPGFNVFVKGGVNKFLFVESKGSVLGTHARGVDGIVASGYTLGTDFEHHDSTTLNAELDLLGTKYSAVVVASDFGGLLKQAELDILNARSGDIISFLNSGGGIYAMAESNSGVGLTPDGGHFGFLPFLVTSTAFNQTEMGIQVTPFGSNLGLINADVNGNVSHNIFNGTFGLKIVDFDPDDNILTLAGRGIVTDNGIVDSVDSGVPEPLNASLAVMGLGVLMTRLCRHVC